MRFGIFKAMGNLEGKCHCVSNFTSFKSYGIVKLTKFIFFSHFQRNSERSGHKISMDQKLGKL